MTARSIRGAAALCAAAAALAAAAPGALAKAPDRKVDLQPNTPFSWDPPSTLGLNAGYNNGTESCGGTPIDYCDVTLIHLPSTGGELTVEATDLSLPTDDVDIYIRESDASGKLGKTVSSSANALGTIQQSEKAKVQETLESYYLAEIVYYTMTPASSFKGKASYKPGPDLASKILRLAKSVKASKLKGFSGTAGSEAAKVQIALVKTSGGCQALQANGAFANAEKNDDGSCGPGATFVDAKGSKKWSFKLRRKLAKGSYTLFTKGVAEDGTEETAFDTGRNRVDFKVS